jgi:alpha-D-ribose 1-methylphosphonate 5-phosphate C-P lyase
MECEFIISKVTISKTIAATNIDAFKTQLKSLLMDAKKPEGIVYVWNTRKKIPRLKGESSIIYIGKANGSLYSRYINNVSIEAKEYWTRYNHIINEYGAISIDIYETENPEKTENNFIYQYHQQFMELPPINLKSYIVGLL